MNGITPVVAWRAYFIDLIEVFRVPWGLVEFLDVEQGDPLKYFTSPR